MEEDLNYISHLLEDFENIVEKSSSKEDRKRIHNELRDLHYSLLKLRDRMLDFAKWSQNDLTDQQYSEIINVRGLKLSKERF